MTFAVFDPIATGPLVSDTLIWYLMWMCRIHRRLSVLFKPPSATDIQTSDMICRTNANNVYTSKKFVSLKTPSIKIEKAILET